MFIRVFQNCKKKGDFGLALFEKFSNWRFLKKGYHDSKKFPHLKTKD